ncbi:hypothetical protein [Williamsia muralis]|uniref:hypothetical protein n=1 Tax=Williamsia marianensis TaxID=85044 RepID=UPI0038096E68
MRTRGAWLIVAAYITAMLVVTIATMHSYTSAWPALLGPLILIAATVALMLVPGDPLPIWPTVALTASGPIACALVLSATPAVLDSSLQTWIHGAGTTIYCYMNVRGRRIAPWIGLASMIAVFAIWSTHTGHGASYGASLVIIDAAPLTMAALLSFTLRPTAKAVFSLRNQTTERIAELSAQTAAAQERSRQIRHLDTLARPLMERIASGATLTTAERNQCALLEAHLRDRLRAPILSTLDLDDAAYHARTRGVEVVFLDDSGPTEPDPSIVDTVHTVASHALNTAHNGTVCVRMWPPARPVVASVLTTNDNGTDRVEIAVSGTVQRTVSTGMI